MRRRHVLIKQNKLYSELSTLYQLLLSSKTVMVGKLGDFQGLNVPTTILATFTKISGRPKDIETRHTMNSRGANVSQVGRVDGKAVCFSCRVSVTDLKLQLNDC